MTRQGSYTDARGVVHAVEINRHGHIDKDSYVADGVARVERPVYVPDDFIRDEADTSHTRRRNSLLRVAYRTLNGIPLDHYKQLWDPHYRPTKELATPLSGSTSLTHEWLYALDGWLRAERTGNAAYVRVFDRDAAGHVVLEYDSGATATSFPVSGESIEYVIRPDGQVASSTQRGATTARTFTKTFSFDPATANESGWTDSVGRSMSFLRDAAGNVKETFDGTARTSATFDAMNRVVETKDALGNATTYRYDHPACGCSQDDLVTAIHTPDLPAGVDWVMAYDGQGRLSSVTDPHGFTESYEYTPTGELTKVKDRLLRDTTYSHDQLGRVLAMVDTLGRTHARSYALPTLTPAQHWTGPTLMAGSADGTAAATSLTAPLRSGDYQIGHNALPISGYPAEVELYRDATFQLALSRQFDLNRRMTLRADRVGEPFDSTRGASAATTGGFWQNQKSWNIFTSAPVLSGDSALTSGGSESASIAQNDFYEDVSANGYGGGTEGWARETMTRDAAGRVTELRRRLLASSAFGTVAADNVLSTYTYRPDGRLERLVNPDGTHDFTYDSRGLMQTQSVLGEGTYTYGYDEMGRNSFLEYPDGHTRAQVFDDLGRITSRCYEYSLGSSSPETTTLPTRGRDLRIRRLRAMSRQSSVFRTASTRTPRAEARNVWTPPRNPTARGACVTSGTSAGWQRYRASPSMGIHTAQCANSPGAGCLASTSTKKYSPPCRARGIVRRDSRRCDAKHCGGETARQPRRACCKRSSKHRWENG